jgi:Fuc2NAc and GlcNAc transferase
VRDGENLKDATVTIVRRSSRRERLYEAHRSHSYQRLARRWASHRRVTVTFLLMNLLWLLPCALLTVMYPNRAPWIVIVALTPLVLGAVLAGAGRP